MEQKKFKRGQLWVDSAFQSRMLFRVGCYALFLVFMLWHVTFVFDLMGRIASSNVPNWDIADFYVDFASRQKPLLLSFVLIMPILLYDMLKFSHRIAGPLYRARRYINDMVDGKAVPEFKPREKDLMLEFFNSFNALTKIWNAQLQSSSVQDQHDALAPKTANGEAVKAPSYKAI